MSDIKHGTEGKHGGGDKVKGGFHVGKGGRAVPQNHPYKEPVGPKQVHGHHFKGVNHGNGGTQRKG